MLPTPRPLGARVRSTVLCTCGHAVGGVVRHGPTCPVGVAYRNLAGEVVADGDRPVPPAMEVPRTVDVGRRLP